LDPIFDDLDRPMDWGRPLATAGTTFGNKDLQKEERGTRRTQKEEKREGKGMEGKGRERAPSRIARRRQDGDDKRPVPAEEESHMESTRNATLCS
jgi:hypothetical protein